MQVYTDTMHLRGWLTLTRTHWLLIRVSFTWFSPSGLSKLQRALSLDFFSRFVSKKAERWCNQICINKANRNLLALVFCSFLRALNKDKKVDEDWEIKKWEGGKEEKLYDHFDRFDIKYADDWTWRNCSRWGLMLSFGIRCETLSVDLMNIRVIVVGLINFHIGYYCFSVTSSRISLDSPNL
jgi:hypothetical protein